MVVIRVHHHPNNLLYNRPAEKIVVRIDTEHVETFKEAFDTKPFRTTDKHSDFIVQTSSRYRGDDETVMYEIDYMLPDLPAFTGWSVLWEESDW